MIDKRKQERSASSVPSSLRGQRKKRGQDGSHTPRPSNTLDLHWFQVRHHPLLILFSSSSRSHLKNRIRCLLRSHRFHCRCVTRKPIHHPWLRFILRQRSHGPRRLLLHPQSQEQGRRSEGSRRHQRWTVDVHDDVLNDSRRGIEIILLGSGSVHRTQSSGKRCPVRVGDNSFEDVRGHLRGRL